MAPSKFEQETRSKLRKERGRIDDLAKQQSAQIEDIKNHEQRITDLERMNQGKPPTQPPVDDSLPARVYDVSTLTQFVRVMFPAMLTTYFTPNRKEPSRQIRDALIATYDDLVLHPDWTNTSRSHLDAVYRPIENMIYDFSVGSTEPGELQLAWTPVTPE